ncbi:hypothetical protein BTA51_24270 [Hahella sp. CCB-MM4]|uniref:DUF1801 domain-containing protein n=1 Tax=Hahella sp. (strain CCB-MM4) TaxID=1926491 RepID=UPI000B9AAE82|nr:DUF1801 domain-containing protein [Hahella sp. CCB-MM4]OZG70710.1 hypothetical protein BTA51_24270 [Hahella sp. CCB-MM4]
MKNQETSTGITPQDREVRKKFADYPDHVRSILLSIRSLILETARELGIDQVTETLKWGEPSYFCPGGSTVRIDWKAATPERYAVYFHCQTRLVETFRELYGDLFEYDGHRAIVFNLGQVVPTQELKHCIGLSLQYHQLKRLPLLGATPVS